MQFSRLSKLQTQSQGVHYNGKEIWFPFRNKLIGSSFCCLSEGNFNVADFLSCSPINRLMESMLMERKGFSMRVFQSASQQNNYFSPSSSLKSESSVACSLSESLNTYLVCLRFTLWGLALAGATSIVS